MTVEEKVFYTDKKAVLDREALKLLGYKYESGATLGTDKTGFYMVIKAEKKEFDKAEVKEALKDTTEVKAKEKDKVLAKFKELEENAAGGIAMFD